MKLGHGSKTIAALMLFVFTISTVARSAPLPEFGEIVGPAKFRINPGELSIPEELGVVNEIYFSGKEDAGMVVYIQEAHGVYEAQKNISRILNDVAVSLKDKTPVICLEGNPAGEEIDHRILSGFPIKSVKEEISHYFAKRAKLDGAELYAINDNKRARLVGVDDSQLYGQNVNVYRNSVVRRKEARKAASNVKKRLDRLKRKVFTGELDELDKASEKFSGDYSMMPSHIGYLKRIAAKRGINLDEFREFLAFWNILEIERKMNGDALDNEIRKAGITLESENKSALTGKNFYSRTEIERQLKEKDLNPDDFPYLQMHLAYVEKLSHIEAESLFDEINGVTRKIRKSLFRTETEKQVAAADDYVKLLDKLINLEVSDREFSDYLEMKEILDNDKTWKRLSRLFLEYSIPNGFENDLGKIKEAQPLVENFYTLAHARNKALFNNTVKMLEDRDSVFLVTGGFHSNPIARLLREEKISYILISPVFSEMEGISDYWANLGGGMNGVEFLLQFFTVKLRSFLNDPVFRKEAALMLLSRAASIEGINLNDVFEAYKAELDLPADIDFVDALEHIFEQSGALQKKVGVFTVDGRPFEIVINEISNEVTPLDILPEAEEVDVVFTDAVALDEKTLGVAIYSPVSAEARSMGTNFDNYNQLFKVFAKQKKLPYNQEIISNFKTTIVALSRLVKDEGSGAISWDYGATRFVIVSGSRRTADESYNYNNALRQLRSRGIDAEKLEPYLTFQATVGTGQNVETRIYEIPVRPEGFKTMDLARREEATDALTLAPEVRLDAGTSRDGSQFPVGVPGTETMDLESWQQPGVKPQPALREQPRASLRRDYPVDLAGGAEVDFDPNLTNADSMRFIQQDYEVVRELGRGSFGVVFEVKQKSTGQTMAMKIPLIRMGLDGSLDRRYLESLERFLIEARTALMIEHPNFPKAYGLEQYGNLVCFTMEHLEGQELKDLIPTFLREGKEGINDALEIMEDVARAINYLHEGVGPKKKPVVHRDLKPENIFITADGTPKILDLGLARVLKGQAGDDPTMSVSIPSLTGTGDVLGSPIYMSYEQVRGRKDLIRKPACDVYLLGSNLYHLLTGEFPHYKRGEPFEIGEYITRVKRGPPPTPPTAIRPEIPMEVENLILKALSFNQEDRGTAEEFADAIRDYLEKEKPLGKIKTAFYVLKRNLKARIIAYAVMGVFFIGFFFALIAFENYRQSKIEQQARADIQEARQRLREARKERRAKAARFLQTARNNYEAGDTQAALDAYRTFLDFSKLDGPLEDPAELEALFYSASIQASDGKYEAAKAKFQRVINSGGRSEWVPKAHLELAKIAVREGNYTEAFSHLETVKNNFRAEVERRALVSAYQEYAGQAQDAKDFPSAGKLWGGYADFLQGTERDAATLKSGRFLLRGGVYDEAVSAYESYVEANAEHEFRWTPRFRTPDDIPEGQLDLLAVKSELVRAYVGAGKLAEAGDLVREIIRAYKHCHDVTDDKSSVNGYLFLAERANLRLLSGQIQALRGNYRQAEREWQAVINGDFSGEAKERARLNIAESRMVQADWDGAREVFRHIFEEHKGRYATGETQFRFVAGIAMIRKAHAILEKAGEREMKEVLENDFFEFRRRSMLLTDALAKAQDLVIRDITEITNAPDVTQQFIASEGFNSNLRQLPDSDRAEVFFIIAEHFRIQNDTAGAVEYYKKFLDAVQDKTDFRRKKAQKFIESYSDAEGRSLGQKTADEVRLSDTPGVVVMQFDERRFELFRDPETDPRLRNYSAGIIFLYDEAKFGNLTDRYRYLLPSLKIAFVPYHENINQIDSQDLENIFERAAPIFPFLDVNLTAKNVENEHIVILGDRLTEQLTDSAVCLLYDAGAIDTNNEYRTALFGAALYLAHTGQQPTEIVSRNPDGTFSFVELRIEELYIAFKANLQVLAAA